MKEVIEYCFPDSTDLQQRVASIIRQQIKRTKDIKKHIEAPTTSGSVTDSAYFVRTLMSAFKLIRRYADSIFPQTISHHKFAELVNDRRSLKKQLHSNQIHGFASTLSLHSNPQELFSSPSRIFGSVPHRADAFLLCHQQYDWLGIMVAEAIAFNLYHELSHELTKQTDRELPHTAQTACARVCSLLSALLTPTIHKAMRPSRASKRKLIVYVSDEAKQQLVLTPAGIKLTSICARTLTRLIDLTATTIFILAPTIVRSLRDLPVEFYKNTDYARTIFSFIIENIMPLSNGISVFIKELKRYNALVDFLDFYRHTTPRPLPRLQRMLIASINNTPGVHARVMSSGDYELFMPEQTQEPETHEADLSSDSDSGSYEDRTLTCATHGHGSLSSSIQVCSHKTWATRLIQGALRDVPAKQCTAIYSIHSNKLPNRACDDVITMARSQHLPEYMQALREHLHRIAQRRDAILPDEQRADVIAANLLAAESLAIKPKFPIGHMLRGCLNKAKADESSFSPARSRFLCRDMTPVLRLIFSFLPEFHEVSAHAWDGPGTAADLTKHALRLLHAGDPRFNMMYSIRPRDLCHASPTNTINHYFCLLQIFGTTAVTKHSLMPDTDYNYPPSHRAFYMAAAMTIDLWPGIIAATIPESNQIYSYDEKSELYTLTPTGKQFKARVFSRCGDTRDLLFGKFAFMMMRADHRPSLKEEFYPHISGRFSQIVRTLIVEGMQSACSIGLDIIIRCGFLQRFISESQHCDNMSDQDHRNIFAAVLKSIELTAMRSHKGIDLIRERLTSSAATPTDIYSMFQGLFRGTEASACDNANHDPIDQRASCT